MNAKQAAEKLKSYGRYGDTELVHMSKGEVNALRGIAQLAGGDLTRNPKTDQPEAFFLAALLPSLIGGLGSAMGLGALGTAALGAGVGALTNKDNPLMGAVMGGLGGYGGGQLAAGLQGVGVNAAQQTAMQAAQPLAQQAVGQGLQAGATQGLQAGLTQGLNPNVLAPELVGQTAAQNTLAANATTDFLQKPFYTQAMEGGKALMQPGGFDQFVQGQGGMMPTMKNVGMAAAPMLYDQMMPKSAGGMGSDKEDPEIPKYKYTAGLTGDYYQPGQGTYERQHFTQPTFQRMAKGGIVQLAKGGTVHMETGGFVFPADIPAAIGAGSSNAGQEILAARLGAQKIDGPGDGQSDDVPATIDGKPIARVARDEMYLTPEQVADIGGGDHAKGSKKLYTMLDRIRKQAVGHTKQVKPVDLDRALA
jgi:hypothetical protein